MIVSLYYFVNKYQINKESNASIEVFDSTFNFGQIRMSDTLKHTFIVKNISKIELIIKNIESGCECTVTNFDKNPVKKGELTEISVTFVPLHTGKVEKNILFEANTEPPFTVLTLKGLVK